MRLFLKVRTAQWPLTNKKLKAYLECNHLFFRFFEKILDLLYTRCETHVMFLSYCKMSCKINSNMLTFCSKVHKNAGQFSTV